jgi:hypothetical protein
MPRLPGLPDVLTITVFTTVAAPESYVASEPFREEHKARMGSLLAGPLLGKFNREGASKPAERKRKRSLPWVALQLLREKKCDAEEAVAQLGSLMVRDTIGLQGEGQVLDDASLMLCAGDVQPPWCKGDWLSGCGQ